MIDQAQPPPGIGRRWRPELEEAIAHGKTVGVAEGEKDVDTLAGWNVTATTRSGGAGKWLDKETGLCPVLESFTGADVVICTDNDAAGREHGHTVATSLLLVAARVRFVDIAALWPECPPKGDISDFSAAGGTPDAFWSFVEKLPQYEPPSGAAGKRREDGAWDDPDLSILDGRRGVLPPFPVETMPSLAAWIIDSARGASVTPGHVPIRLEAIDRSGTATARRIRASRAWSEPLALWTGVVGFSGTGKTPGIDVTTRALSMIESSRRDKISDLRRRHEARCEGSKAARKKWKQEVEESVEAGLRVPDMPVEAIDPGPFVAPRLVVSDATTERLAVLLQARPRGLALVADELAGLFSTWAAIRVAPIVNSGFKLGTAEPMSSSGRAGRRSS